jgi:hypothetical protein
VCGRFVTEGDDVLQVAVVAVEVDLLLQRQQRCYPPAQFESVLLYLVHASPRAPITFLMSSSDQPLSLP